MMDVIDLSYDMHNRAESDLYDASGSESHTERQLEQPPVRVEYVLSLMCETALSPRGLFIICLCLLKLRKLLQQIL
jgi:hypothetical protein